MHFRQDDEKYKEADGDDYIEVSKDELLNMIVVSIFSGSFAKGR